MISHRTANDCTRILKKWQKKHKLRDEVVEELLKDLQHVDGSQSFATSMLCLAQEFKASSETPDDPYQE